MNMLIKENPPKRDDEKAARRWRGPLFAELSDTHPNIDTPGSVTFPICAFCGHVVWEWPHFEEPVPKDAICDQCLREEIAAQERDNDLMG
jgi:hypothetical protein